jgi:hypothetical protein
MAEGNKKAFDAARSSFYSMDPIRDIVIAGGLVLPKDEQGEHDTDEDQTDALYDERLHMPLDEDFTKGVDAFGVRVAIIISKRDGRPFVIDGRQRVRAARKINRQREKRGEVPLMVKCDVHRTDDAGLLGTMILLNEGRVDDEVETKTAKLKRLMERGVTIEQAALRFKRDVVTLKGWLAFEDNAIAPLKKAVEKGAINQTAASAIARLDPEKQKEATEKLLASVPAGGKITRAKAKEAAKRATAKPNANLHEMSDRRSLKKLLKQIEDMSHANASDRALAFWEGVENALRLVTGSDELDSRLANQVEKLRSAEKE